MLFIYFFFDKMIKLVKNFTVKRIISKNNLTINIYIYKEKERKRKR